MEPRPSCRKTSVGLPPLLSPIHSYAIERPAAVAWGIRRILELHRLAVSGELEVAAPYFALSFERAYGTFPVHGPDARARVELLIVHEGLETQIVDLHGNR